MVKFEYKQKHGKNPSYSIPFISINRNPTIFNIIYDFSILTRLFFLKCEKEPPTIRT